MVSNLRRFVECQTIGDDLRGLIRSGASTRRRRGFHPFLIRRHVAIGSDDALLEADFVLACGEPTRFAHMQNGFVVIVPVLPDSGLDLLEAAWGPTIDLKKLDLARIVYAVDAEVVAGVK